MKTHRISGVASASRGERERTRRSYAHLFCHKTFSFLGREAVAFKCSECISAPQPGRTPGAAALRSASGSKDLLPAALPCARIYVKLQGRGHSYPFSLLQLGEERAQTRFILPERSSAIGISLPPPPPTPPPGANLDFTPGGARRADAVARS